MKGIQIKSNLLIVISINRLSDDRITTTKEKLDFYNLIIIKIKYVIY